MPYLNDNLLTILVVLGSTRTATLQVELTN